MPFDDQRWIHDYHYVVGVQVGALISSGQRKTQVFVLSLYDIITS